MLSEISQTEKDKYFMITYMSNLKYTKNMNRTKKRGRLTDTENKSREPEGKKEEEIRIWRVDYKLYGDFQLSRSSTLH